MLKDRIQKELNKAVKKGDEIACSTLRQLLAAVLTKEKEKRYKLSKQEPDLVEQELAEKSNLTDEEIIEVISSENKKRKESIIEFEKGKRDDLVKKEKAENEILEKYLPKQLSEEEIKTLVKQAIEEINAQDMKDTGKLMGVLMPKIKGRADGGLVSRIVKELLAS